MGWNSILHPPGPRDGDPWDGSPLAGQPEGSYMYFVHSFHARPKDPDVVLSLTRYGPVEFCSSLQKGNIMAFQFHPERSGRRGLEIYRRMAGLIAA